MDEEPLSRELSALEYQFLLACRESVQRQGELLPLLAATVGVPPERLYYAWMERRFPRIQPSAEEPYRLQSGEIAGSDWCYFFHGLECDFSHRDGRYLRVEFGPRGHLDCLDGWGVLQYVMTARPPWREFPELREHLAEDPPPYTPYSGSHHRMRELWDRLKALNLVVPAEPEWYALVQAHTIRLPNGSTRYENLPVRSQEEADDVCVASRVVLSRHALALCEAAG